jgi:hypothetical protein
MRQFIRFAVFRWAIAFALLSASYAKAEVYYVDIFGPAPDGIAVGRHSYASTNACSATTCAGGGFATAFYEFQPGDTVDFGSIRLGSSIFGDGRQMRYYGQYPYNTAGYEVALYTGSLRVLYDYSSFIQLGTGFTASCTTADPACIPRLTNMLHIQNRSL